MKLSHELSLTGGSREHYFHFLIGYLLPTVHAQAHRRFDRFQVLDCGPLMTPILQQSLDLLGHDFDVVADDAITAPVFVATWDRMGIYWESTEAVRAAAEAVRQAWRHPDCPRGDCPRSPNLLLRRSEPHDYYSVGRAQVDGYGTGRRGITNLEAVSALLRDAGIAHSVYEAGSHSLGCQIASFANAERVLGMRGAEWANMIWCDSATTRIRMLDPEPPADLLNGFFERLGIPCETAVVAATHSPEDPREALRFFRD